MGLIHEMLTSYHFHRYKNEYISEDADLEGLIDAKEPTKDNLRLLLFAVTELAEADYD